MFFRIVINSEKEEILGKHDAPVRCVEYSYAAGELKLISHVLVIVFVCLIC